MYNIDFKRKAHADVTTEIVTNGIAPYISFKALEETGLVRNGFSTRLGGVSKDFLSSLNLGFGRGESDENVLENFRRIAESIGFDYERLVTTNQTHTTNIRVVTEKDAGKGITIPRDYSDIDGLITNVPKLPLVTFYADCVPLYFLDPVKKAIGLSHSGWRGTVGRIGGKTIRLMAENYGSRPEDIIACIGPSICCDCYEVSEDVALEFVKEFGITEILPYEPGSLTSDKTWTEEKSLEPQNIKSHILYKKPDGKYRLNLWNACRLGMLDAGLKAENIHTTDICTCCNPDLLYSHRASHGKRGSLAAFLMLD